MFSSMVGEFCKYVYVKDTSITLIEKLIHLKWSVSCWMAGILINILNKIDVIEHEIIQTLIKFVNSCNFEWNSSFLVYCSYISLTQIVGTYSLHEIQTGSLKLLVSFCFFCVTCINTEKFPVDWVYFQLKVQILIWTYCCWR